MRFKELSLWDKVGFCGAAASIATILTTLVFYLHPRGQVTRELDRQPVIPTGLDLAAGSGDYSVPAHDRPPRTPERSPLPTPPRSIRLGVGNISDLKAKLRSDVVELTFKNCLWLSSLLVSYDGVSQGKMRQLDRMTLTVPATPGTHRLTLVAEKGSFDAGRTWYRDIVVQ